MTQAWSKETKLSPWQKLTHDIPNVGQKLFPVSYKNSRRASPFNMHPACILLGSAVLFPSLKFTIVSFISAEKLIKMILGLLVRPFIGRVLNKPRQWYGLCVHPPLVGRYRFYVHMEVFVHCWYQSLAFWTCPVKVSLCHPWSTCKELLLTKLLLVI